MGYLQSLREGSVTLSRFTEGLIDPGRGEVGNPYEHTRQILVKPPVPIPLQTEYLEIRDSGVKKRSSGLSWYREL